MLAERFHFLKEWLQGTPSADEPHGWQTSHSKTSRANRGHTHTSGLDLETKTFSPTGSRRSLFLDIAFIEQFGDIGEIYVTNTTAGKKQNDVVSTTGLNIAFTPSK